MKPYARAPRGARRTSERGAAAIEFLGVIPALLLAAVIALQLGIVGWTISAAGEAARAGARAASLSADPHSAAQRALPGRLSDGAVLNGSPAGDGYLFTAQLRIPSLIPGVSLPTVTRSAHMPDIS